MHIGIAALLSAGGHIVASASLYGGGRALAAMIPGAALVIVGGAGHVLTAGRTYEAVEAIAEHLAMGGRRQRRA